MKKFNEATRKKIREYYQKSVRLERDLLKAHYGVDDGKPNFKRLAKRPHGDDGRFIKREEYAKQLEDNFYLESGEEQ